MSSSDIGVYIRKYRKKNDLTLRDLSKRSGISFSHLSKIERGEHIPSKRTLDLLAESIDVDKDKLYVLSGYAPSNKLGKGLDYLFEIPDPENQERINIINDIVEEFPDADLMFKDMESLTSEQLKEVYNFIKFKKGQDE